MVRGCRASLGDCPRCAVEWTTRSEDEHARKMQQLLYKILWNEKRMRHLIDDLELRNWYLKSEARSTFREYANEMRRKMARCAHEEDSQPAEASVNDPESLSLNEK